MCYVLLNCRAEKTGQRRTEAFYRTPYGHSPSKQGWRAQQRRGGALGGVGVAVGDGGVEEAVGDGVVKGGVGLRRRAVRVGRRRRALANSVERVKSRALALERASALYNPRITTGWLLEPAVMSHITAGSNN
jgi:hypothetical protein